MRAVTWLCAWIVLGAVPALARDLFVNNVAGDDRRDALQQEAQPNGDGPVRTIGRGLALAEAGDRVVLVNTGQPYHESLTLEGHRHCGFSDRPFSLVGNGAVLDGSQPVPADGWKPYLGDVFHFCPPTRGLQMLFYKGRPLPQVPVKAGAETPPKLREMEWCLFDGCIYFHVGPDRLARDYELSYSDQETGITLYHVWNVAILNLVVQGFRVDGINAANSAKDIKLVGVTSRGNGRAGIVVGGASLVDIESCLVGNNSRQQLLTLPYSETHIRASEFLSLTAPAWVDQGGKTYLGTRQVQGGLEKIEAK